MKIGGDNRVVPYRNTWLAAARDLTLDPDALMTRVRELAALAPEVFASAASVPEVEALGRPLPARLGDLVADRATRCRHLLQA
jgi:hypothetical protein